ncbi:DNA-methyltransferase [Calditrichota bacterium]
MLNLNHIYNIDCLDGLKQIESNTAELVLTDIPYSVVSRDSNGLRVLDKESADIMTFDIDQFLAELVRVCKGSIYVFCGTEQVSFIRDYLVKAGLSTRLIIWEKSNPSPMNGDYIWLSGVETCVFGKFAGATFNEHCKNSVLKFPTGRSKIHPTEKPLKLFKYLVEVSSKEGDLVIDPCIGSGTTAIACMETKRNYIGFELYEEYYKKCISRIEKWKQDYPLLYKLFQDYSP